jgi:hypothetical protein
MGSTQNLTNLPPDPSCQYDKYQWVIDILNSLGLGVKVSFRMVDSFAVLKPSNSKSSHHSQVAFHS